VTQPSERKTALLPGFRTKLFAGMMLVVFGLTATGLYLAERNAAEDAQRDLDRDFQSELARLHAMEELRYAALAERCRNLIDKPRIHAALEDNALDLLYPSAKEELRDIMQSATPAGQNPPSRAPQARFYRFLNGAGGLLPPPDPADVGVLRPEEEVQLSVKPAPQSPQIGYLLRKGDAGDEIIDEIIALPINSTETNEVIAALVVGFKPIEVAEKRSGEGMKSGIWMGGALHLPALSETARAVIDREMNRLVTAPTSAERSSRVQIEGEPHFLFFKRLNPESVFPAVYEVCVYPLKHALAQQRRLRWQILSAGAALLLAGFVATHLLARRLWVPVEKLAVDSEENREHRQRAEAKLASTSEELQRSARFSADASHQLKTPVTVLRAGLEGLLRREDFSGEIYDELSDLHHQTYRLTGVIDDLLLLSRMDAGRLQIEFNPVNLTELVDEWLDDLNALPDPLGLEIKASVPSGLHIAGEKRYASLILQNLLENARKYNRPGGRVQVNARAHGSSVFLTVGNTGPAIPVEMQSLIFERFSRGTNGEKVAGHGLGLNLAGELVRLHGGEMRLVSSDENWTEFEVRFRAAEQVVSNSSLSA
jgi:signal transduction histidine kinase